MAQSVIGSQFIVPYELNVIVNRHKSGDLVFTDKDEKIVFTITSRERLPQDECGTPIAMLRAKNKTAHDRWNVFKGQSKADSDMIFSATTNDIIQNGTHMHPVENKDKVYPNVDYAFVAVVDAIKSAGKFEDAAKFATFVVG
ncbi:hypothetical protein L1987_85865 [Smallanthus sonchifolius]|uniref:Uncharacterized protein n=1 Tax=Smallanthus sonchifolius TaxID=185202 RepID=A0ACB8XXX1_9ASTR|nr:hypothetical protein L1987_85865 [Smallanthus sonchifolius]